jgi:hypothetical protein
VRNFSGDPIFSYEIFNQHLSGGLITNKNGLIPHTLHQFTITVKCPETNTKPEVLSKRRVTQEIGDLCLPTDTATSGQVEAAPAKQGVQISKFVVDHVQNSLNQENEDSYQSRAELQKQL